MEKHPLGPERKDRSNGTTEPLTLRELGISCDQSSRWQQLAGVPSAPEAAVHVDAVHAGDPTRRLRRRAKPALHVQPVPLPHTPPDALSLQALVLRLAGTLPHVEPPSVDRPPFPTRPYPQQ